MPTKDKTSLGLHRKLPGALWTLISGVATILAFWILWPRMTVTISNPPIDPQNVFSASFAISNTGNIPLTHADISIMASYLLIPTPKNPIIVKGEQPDLGTGKQGLHFANPSWRDHYIGLDKSVTISPESQIVGKVAEADLVILVSYQPWFLPLVLEKRFRFVARKDGSGNIYWRTWPLNEVAPPN